jgi:peptidoglycan-associated lipoprotein
MVTRYSHVLAALTTLIAAYGCSETKAAVPPPATPIAAAPIAQAPLAAPIATVNPKPDDDATRGTIAVSYDIRKSCGMTDDDAHFAFDSAHVVDLDKKMLRTLADCFVSGPLKGRQMSLVGHADPRGSEDYNLALAGRRADNVKTIIVAENMSDARISTTSRGALDATGTEEVSWAADRRVDVNLGK